MGLKLIKKIAENSRDYAFVADEHLNVTWMNRSLSSARGKRQKSVVGICDEFPIIESINHGKAVHEGDILCMPFGKEVFVIVQREDDFLGLLKEATERIITSSTLEEALGGLLNKLCEATGWEYGESWIPDGDVLVAGPIFSGEGLSEFAEYSSIQKFKRGKGLIGRVWKEKKPEWKYMSRKGKTFTRRKKAQQAGIQTVFGVPLIHDKEVMAILAFASLHERPHDLEFIDFLGTLGAYLGKLLEKKDYEEGLRKTTLLLESINKSGEQMINSHNLATSIEKALAFIGKATGADRTYVFRNQKMKGKLFTSQLYEWTGKGISSQQSSTQDVSWDMFPSWKRKLESGEIVVESVEELNHKGKQYLKNQDIVSLLMVPIKVGNAWWGFMGMDYCSEQKKWEDADIQALRSVSNMIGLLITKDEKESSLEEREKKFHHLFDSMVQGVVYQNSAGEIVLANPAAEKILGVTIDQMQGRTSMDKSWRTIREDGSDFPGDEHPAMISLKTGKPVRDVIMGVYRPGTKDYAWIIVNAIPTKENGKVVEVFASFEDITELKEARDRAEENEDKYRSIIEHSPDSIIIIDSNGKIVECNPEAVRDTGITREKLFGKFYSDFPGLKNVKEANDYFNDIFTGKPVDPFEIETENEKGETLINEIRLSPIKQGGKIVQVMVAARDITKRKRAEEANYEAKKFMNDIIDTLADPVFVKDDEHNWVLLNEAMCKMMGHERKDLLYKSDYDFFPKEEADVFWEKDEKVLRTGMEDVNQESFTDAKGKTHTIITKKNLFENMD